MIHYRYVYLIKSEQRLVILKQPVYNSDYHMLLNNNGSNPIELETYCKLFCMGYIYGHNDGDRSPIVNSIYEFQ